MQKVRVYQLAKELKVQSALILELLDRLGEEVTSDLSTLDMGTADLVRQKVTSALQAETQRLAAEHEQQAPPAAEPVEAETAAEATEEAAPAVGEEAPVAEETPASVAADTLFLLMC